MMKYVYLFLRKESESGGNIVRLKIDIFLVDINIGVYNTS